MNNSDTKIPNYDQSILLVDDDRLILSTLTSHLKGAGYKVDSVESINAAKIWLADNKPDVVVVDVHTQSQIIFR